MATAKYSETEMAAFLKFYVHHFQDNDLEVVSQYDTDNHDTELNFFINQDRNFRMKDIVPVLVKKHPQIITALLDDVITNAQIDLEQFPDDTAWEQWYRDQKQALTDPDR
ncbi:hypothetical protein HU830_04350 [Lactobacillus sp. DCY120]|uniref:Uncharacterized protein n=1 Tax=Bombilactobacillus apium TaxID=2675299 RepID=A0A850R6X8_9LACO|nr:hypothetical protein [Bombilactobacillus apium]NVY96402.1 hypothetical protein [Bombilactobacillus apium]